jgi:hypothetical protein
MVIGLAALLLAGALFTVWFINNFEYVSEQVRGGMGAEARRNPLLAAQYYLSRLGVTAEAKTGRQLLIEPPREPGLLLVRDLGPPIAPSRLASLLAWVERGGILVVTPGSAIEEGAGHPLLQHFDVTLESDELTEEEEAVPVTLPWSEESLQIGFDSARWFSVDSENSYWATPDDEFPHLVRFPWGEGSVTFLSDNQFLTNGLIGDKDHALLLASLAEDADQAWLLYNSQMPSLLALLWRQAPYLIISLALFCATLVWRLRHSNGPLIPPPMTGQRNLLEHLQATAEFAWRHNPSVGLLEATRNEVEKRWLTSHPLLQQMDDKGRCDWLAKRTGMTADALYYALYSRQGDTAQMIKTTIILQRLFSALHPDRK